MNSKCITNWTSKGPETVTKRASSRARSGMVRVKDLELVRRSRYSSKQKHAHPSTSLLIVVKPAKRAAGMTLKAKTIAALDNRDFRSTREENSTPFKGDE